MQRWILILLLAAAPAGAADNPVERGLQKAGKAMDRAAKATGRALDRAGKATQKGLANAHKKVDERVRPNQ